MKIHFVIHESYEGPGAIVQWVEKNHHNLSYSRLYGMESLPNLDDFDMLIVMGGPQSPATTVKECPHYDVQSEMQLIRQAIEDDKYVLGICLGAQLIGDALGGHFETSPHKEIGVYSLQLTPAASEDPIFSKFPQSFPAGHWHGDMPGLTDDSVVLAYSAGCPRQIIRYAPKVYGLQCHLEFNNDAIEGMIKHCGHELTDDRFYIQTAAELRHNDYDAVNRLLFKFLEQFCQLRENMPLCS